MGKDENIFFLQLTLILMPTGKDKRIAAQDSYQLLSKISKRSHPQRYLSNFTSRIRFYYLPNAIRASLL